MNYKVPLQWELPNPLNPKPLNRSSLSRFLSSPFIIGVPFFILFCFNKETITQEPSFEGLSSRYLGFGSADLRSFHCLGGTEAIKKTTKTYISSSQGPLTKGFWA